MKKNFQTSMTAAFAAIVITIVPSATAAAIQMMPMEQAVNFLFSSPDGNPFSETLGSKSKQAVIGYARTHSTYESPFLRNDPWGTSRMVINGKYFSTYAIRFMPQRVPHEVCTQDDGDGHTPTYRCLEGHPLYESCHLFFLNDAAQIKAVHEFKINNVGSSKPAFCNLTAAIGLGSRDPGTLLVTLQYFDTDVRPARSAKELGDNWHRSTFLLRVDEKDGELTVTQDDRCLGNPNPFDTITAARKALKASTCW